MTRPSIRSVLLGALLLASAAAPTLAAPFDARPVDAPAFMREGEEVRGPTGFYDLCARIPWECPAPPPAADNRDIRVVLGDDDLAALDALNRTLNHAYRPALDRDTYGVSDYWATPIDAADCEDYVLAKRAALVANGWPPQALLISVVRGAATPYHAVLVARTNRGELVLDNLNDAVLDWREAGYEWVVRQSMTNPGIWVRLLDHGATQAGGGPLTLGAPEQPR